MIFNIFLFTLIWNEIFFEIIFCLLYNNWLNLHNSYFVCSFYLNVLRNLLMNQKTIFGPKKLNKNWDENNNNLFVRLSRQFYGKNICGASKEFIKSLNDILNLSEAQILGREFYCYNIRDSRESRKLRVSHLLYKV